MKYKMISTTLNCWKGKSCIIFCVFLIWISCPLKVFSAVDASETSHTDSTSHYSTQDEKHYAIYSGSIYIIITCIIVATVIFEHAKEHLLHKSTKYMRPVLEQLFSEIAILGFISILTLIIDEYGGLDQLSEKLYANHAHGEYVLSHAIHEVHYFIFGVMVIFVCEVIYLMRFGVSSNKDWKKYNEEVQKPDWEEEYDNKMPKYRWFLFLNEAYRAYSFHSLRKEFIEGRLATLPFGKFSEDDWLSPRFDYSLYLSIVYAETVAEIVNLKSVVWFVIWVLAFIYCWVVFAFYDTIVNAAWLWASVSWVGLAIMVICYFYSKHILHQCINLEDFPQELAKLIWTNKELQRYGAKDATLSSINRPLWTYRQEKKLDIGSFSKKVFGEHPNRFESCFWFGRNGPHLCICFLQLVLIAQSIYISVAIWLIWTVIEPDFDAGTVAGYFFYSMSAPLLVMTLLMHHVTRNFVHISCINSFRKPEAIKEVLRRQKTVKALNALLLLNNLAFHAESEIEDEQHYNPDDPESMKTFITEHKKSLDGTGKIQFEEMEALFDKFDHQKTGSIDTDQINGMMMSLGHPLNEAQLKTLMQSLDRNGNGYVDKDEFMAWQIKKMRVNHECLSPHELAVRVFREFAKVARNRQESHIDLLHSKQSVGLVETSTCLTENSVTFATEITNGLINPPSNFDASAPNESGVPEKIGFVPQFLKALKLDKSKLSSGSKVNQNKSSLFETLKATVQAIQNGKLTDDKAAKAIEWLVNQSELLTSSERQLLVESCTAPIAKIMLTSEEKIKGAVLCLNLVSRILSQNLEDCSDSMASGHGGYSPRQDAPFALRSEVTISDGGIEEDIPLPQDRKQNFYSTGPPGTHGDGDEEKLVLSIDEMIAGLEQMNSGLELQDIYDLIRDVDEDGDGQIDVHEFASLLERYADMEHPEAKYNKTATNIVGKIKRTWRTQRRITHYPTPALKI